MTLFAEIAGRKGDSGVPLREAVARSLERICATRLRDLLLAPDYGVGEVTSLFHSFPQIDAWAADLQRAIAAYEPRLGRVQVVPVVNDTPDLTLRAEIRGVLLVDGGPSHARFSATLDSHHRMNVR
ncbi:MAG TPA: type VI secretion system baseplate subunit TssE [Polyangiaceae bacterium]